MNDFDQNRPAETATAAETGKQPFINQRTPLLAEIADLTQSGKDPSRLRDLKLQYDKERVQFIDQILKTQQQDVLSRLCAQQHASLDALDWISQARERPDLTVPEAIRLADLYQHHANQLSDSLLKERELIQQKRGPAAHRKNGLTSY
jgi:hypothetical protein